MVIIKLGVFFIFKRLTNIYLINQKYIINLVILQMGGIYKMSKLIYKDFLVYMGYFNNKLYAISKDRKLVKYYMEGHRGLAKGNYEIREEEVSDTDMILKYEDYVIEEYHNFYIPHIDSVIIDIHCSSLESEFQSVILSLKKFTILISHLKNTDSDVSILANAIKILLSYSTNKKYKKLKKINVKSHQLLYCDIKTYRKYISNYNEMRASHVDFINAWTRE